MKSLFQIITIIAIIFPLSCSRSELQVIISAKPFHVKTKSIENSSNHYTVSSEEAYRFVTTGSMYSGNKHIFYNFRAL